MSSARIENSSAGVTGAEPAGKRSICILPRLGGLGGPVTFQGRLVEGLRLRGIAVHHDPRRPDTAALLVIGGTRHLFQLIQAQRRGVRIVQRLNGMNWLHRRQSSGLKHYLKSEYNNALLALIRARLADRIVYQSHFARQWWRTVRGNDRVPASVIYNGVDLNLFTPSGTGQPPTDHIRLLLVEGHLRGGYEQGLTSAVRLRQALEAGGQQVKLVVAGDVPPALQARFANPQVRWAGVLPQTAIPEMDRSAHLLFSADLNAACPNAVIEALACGLPVVAFATGSLPELLEGDAGRVAPYGGNYWKLEKPDITELARAAGEVLAGGQAFRRAARARAEAVFGLEQMLDQYQAVLLG